MLGDLLAQNLKKKPGDITNILKKLLSKNYNHIE